MTAGTPVLQVSGIDKRFVEDGCTVEVLRDIAFEARGGEFVSVVGPSGSGKSTLFNIIAGLERADALRRAAIGESDSRVWLARVDPSSCVRVAPSSLRLAS